MPGAARQKWVQWAALAGVAALLLTGLFLSPASLSLAAADGEELNLLWIELPEKGNPKLDSPLDQLVSARARNQAVAFAEQSSIEVVGETVRVVIEAQPGQLEAVTAVAVAQGAVVEASYRDWLQALVPITSLPLLADSPAVRIVRLPDYSLPLVTSQGVGVVNADDWQAMGYTGAGVKIAILDLGFTGYSSLLGTELPSSVITQSFYAGSDIEGDTSHGTACAEVVYDIAPDAQLYLVNYGTTVEKGNAVDWLISQGVDIISASTGSFLAGPGDGTGTANEIVADARSAGILWAQAMANHARRHWQGYFVNTNANQYHEFNPGVDETNAITVSSGSTIEVYLKWGDTWGASANDYDLLLLNNAGSLVAWSTSTQDGNDDPVEYLAYTATYSGFYHIAIGTLGSPALVNFHLYTNYYDLQYQVAASSFGVPADSPNALSVGAVNYSTPTTLESFSSRGPTVDGRVKPDLVAPDGVSSATYGTAAFHGTSAAAPHTAGAAALVKERYPAYTPAQIQAYLEANAVPLGDAGKDNLYGSGRLFLPVPDITVSPTSVSFGGVVVGSSSSPQTITVANNGSAPLAVATANITGTDAAEFSIQNDNVSGQTIAAGDNATIQVVFSPTSTGSKSATLSVPSDDPDPAKNPFVVALSGTGSAAPLGVGGEIAPVDRWAVLAVWLGYGVAPWLLGGGALLLVWRQLRQA